MILRDRKKSRKLVVAPNGDYSSLVSGIRLDCIAAAAMYCQEVVTYFSLKN